MLVPHINQHSPNVGHQHTRQSIDTCKRTRGPRRQHVSYYTV